MSHINLQLAHDRYGRIARDTITLEEHISKEHPELYAIIKVDLDLIIQRIYTVRNEIRRYDYKVPYKTIFK